MILFKDFGTQSGKFNSILPVEVESIDIPSRTSILHTQTKRQHLSTIQSICTMAATGDLPVIVLLKQLIEIPSTSDDELEVGIFLEQHLQSLGYTVERVPISPFSTRHNVYAYLGPKTLRKTRVCLSSHIDTVPPHIPLSVSSDGQTIWGRGACDDKGPLAAQIEAVEELRKEKKIDENGGDISFLFVVGEEKGGPGMLAANDMGLTWEAVIFGEPTEGKLGVGHKGHVVFELSATGIASHSGYPELGSSANTSLIAALSELLGADWPSSELLGPSTFHVGRMSGGVAYNVMAASSEALCAVRVACDLSGIKSKISGIVSNYQDVKIDFKFDYSETLLDHDIEGFATYAAAFGTDVPRLQGQYKKYLYGPGSILNAHGENEHIKVSELLESIEAYKKIILHCLEKN
ncbi:Peptidase M20 domain-containing protein [Lachnellula suecica]|uniref:Peptidase M20 domain-containing protein n=1 Tax=Lachnellula suecica TaxID=602035 RepID=A0A8T9CBQ9_9HELO|nr:Peptidase M20 domain-containing protein [Lachnellula suecica]